MTPQRSRTFVGAALGAALLVGVVACGSDSETSATTTTTPATTPAGAPDQGAFDAAMADPIATWRASYLTSAMTFEVPGTAVGASIGDQPVALAANGDAVIGSRPVAVDDTFHIGSITKLFTAALVTQLDQEGVLSLDDTIDTWFPSAPNGSEITVRMLLEHESGLAEITMDLVGVASNQAVIDDVFARPPISAPGTAYLYLNAGYLILGRITEEAVGEPYDQQVDRRFIERYGLTSTYLDGYGEGPEAIIGYDLECDGGTTAEECIGKPSRPVEVAPSPQWKGAWAAGGMVSTARDLDVWIRALVAGDVVDEAHKAEMVALTPLSTEFYGEMYAKAGIPAVQLGEGAGLASWNVPGVGICHGHAGSIPGSNGITVFCPDENLAVTILNTMDPAGLTPGYPGLVDLAPAALAALTTAG